VLRKGKQFLLELLISYCLSFRCYCSNSVSCYYVSICNIFLAFLFPVHELLPVICLKKVKWRSILIKWLTAVQCHIASIHKQGKLQNLIIIFRLLNWLSICQTDLLVARDIFVTVIGTLYLVETLWHYFRSNCHH